MVQFSLEGIEVAGKDSFYLRKSKLNKIEAIYVEILNFCEFKLG